jgi:hypothetical protein
MSFGILPVLASHLIKIRFLETAENCLKGLDKISIWRSAEIANQIGIEPCLKNFDRFSRPAQRIALKTVNTVTRGNVVDDFAVFLPRLLEIARSAPADDSMRGDCISAITNIASHVQPNRVPEAVIREMAASLAYLDALTHLSTVPGHISSIIRAGFDFQASLGSANDQPGQSQLLRLVQNLLPAPKVLLRFGFPLHPRPPESATFSIFIQPILLNCLMERPLDLYLLLMDLIATIAVQTVVLTDELLIVLRGISGTAPEHGFLVLALLTFYEADPKIAESGILATLSNEGLYGDQKRWFTCTSRRIQKKNSGSRHGDTFMKATIGDIVRLIEANSISKIEFLGTGIGHCIALLSPPGFMTAREAGILADYVISLLDIIPLPPIATNTSVQQLVGLLKKEMVVRVSFPDGSGDSLVQASLFDPLASFEGWYNSLDGYSPEKLLYVANEHPELQDLIVTNQQNMTYSQLSRCFRALLHDYPRYSVRCHHSQYASGAPLFQVVNDLCFGSVFDVGEVHVDLELVAAEYRAPSSLPPIESFGELRQALLLLQILSNSTRIDARPVFCRRIRSQLLNPSDLLCRDSMAIGTIYQCPFLFDFSTRILAFRLVTADLADVLLAASKEMNLDMNLREINSDQIHVHVHRDAVFVDGVTLLTNFASQKLKVSFIGEEGIGRGPTHEFFTLFSRGLCTRSKCLFRTDSLNEFCDSMLGLFFSPAAPIKGIEILGIFLAKAMQMNCLVDINFNPVLFKFLRGMAVDIGDIDPVVAKSLQQPEGLIGLPFVYPGLGIPLTPDGDRIDVTPSNLDEFVRLVKEFTCGSRVGHLVEAFLRGFEQVIPFWTLDLFNEDEICLLLRGENQKFSIDDLAQNVVISHGYTRESSEIQMLFEILAEFSLEQQRLVIQFITGYAQLPIGGLAALEPKLAIAKKEAVDGRHPDEQLPSVMTCTNYFKVPSYSSKEVMRDRILRAITDGRNSFDLT